MNNQNNSSVAKDDAMGGSYPEWLYDYAAIATHQVEGLASVTETNIQTFHERGFLVVKDAFDAQEIQNALQGLTDLIDGKNPEFQGVQFEQAVLAKLEHLNSLQKQDAVRKLFYFVNFDDRLKALSTKPELTKLLGKIIGETDLNMFQDMALLKPPLVGREKPWHQDMAYFDVPLETTVVGVWLALDEATTENGCMMVIPGSHKKGAAIHFKKRDWQICDTDVYNDGAVAIPLKPGSILLFHGLIHHGTPANLSPNRRRALQFHYRAQSVQLSSTEERLANFGSEGTDVSC